MKRVLIIDDDAQLRGLLRLLLEEAGFDVVEACNGREGVQVFRCLHPDLVLCDIYMPEQDGLETIRQLRRHSPTVKIIALSGGAFGGMVDMLPLARRLGAAVCLHKPFTSSRLLQAVEHVLAAVANCA
jgi:CheY-like chemotaxis protein